MKLIPPLEITDAVLQSSTVPETVALWAAGSTYTKGMLARREQTHRVYESLVDGNTGNVPETSLTGTPPKWGDVGSTNRWRMLRTDSNVQTEVAGPLSVVLKPGRRIGALGIVRLQADHIDVSTSDGFSFSESLRGRTVRRWSDYFWSPIQYRGSVLLLNLPRSTNATVTVTLTRQSGPVKSGPMVLGMPVDLGVTQQGARVGSRDFSTSSRNFAGDATLLPRKDIPRTTQNTILDPAQADAVRIALRAQRARVGLYTGLEDTGHPYFDSLAVLGIATNWELNLDPTLTTLNIDLEGF